MALTKTERNELDSLRLRAKKVEADARQLARDTGRELVRQMKKS